MLHVGIPRGLQSSGCLLNIKGAGCGEEGEDEGEVYPIETRDSKLYAYK